MPEPQLNQRIQFYLMSMGYAQDQISESNGRILVSAPNDRIVVVPVNAQQLSDRTALLQIVLGVSNLQREFDRVYLAVPRLFAAVYDTKPFQDQGVGLLVYDSRRIEETLQARKSEVATVSHGGPESKPIEVMAELEKLREAYATLQESIRSLREEISRQTSMERDRIAERLETPPPPVSLVSATPQGSLPVFFENNPWLEVLSRRGKESS